MTKLEAIAVALDRIEVRLSQLATAEDVERLTAKMGSLSRDMRILSERIETLSNELETLDVYAKKLGAVLPVDSRPTLNEIPIVRAKR